MPINQHSCFSANCDECKRSFERDGGNWHWPSGEEALRDVRDYDWFKLPDGRLICDSCIEVLLESGKVIDSERDGFAYEAAADASERADGLEGGTR